MPSGPASCPGDALASVCLSSRPDHTAPVTTVSSASPSQLGWVSSTEVQAEGRGPLLCVHNTLNATHCTVALNRWGVSLGCKQVVCPGATTSLSLCLLEAGCFRAVHHGGEVEGGGIASFCKSQCRSGLRATGWGSLQTCGGRASREVPTIKVTDVGWRQH
ncbi:hypothetical protein NQZ68_016085 [Dissostichus eleginoides]|nr:hypothetical protein NQZ68_016085 [Dissostichus eleginoides]